MGGHDHSGICPGPYGDQASEIRIRLFRIKLGLPELVHDGLPDAGKQPEKVFVPVQLHDLAETVFHLELAQCRPWIVRRHRTQRRSAEIRDIHRDIVTDWRYSKLNPV